MNLAKMRRYFRISPFDISTEEGRSDERYRLAFLSLSANVLSRLAGVVVMLVSIKLTIPYLGAERFGVWMTIAGIVGLLSFMDFGIGNALSNRVSHAAASGNSRRLRWVVSGGLAFLFALGVAISLALNLLLKTVPWQEVIRTSVPSDQLEIVQALSVLAVLFGFSVFAGGAQRVFAGLQRAYEAHLVNFACSCVSLMLLLIAAKSQAGIPVLVAITLGVQIFSGFLLIAMLIRRRIFVLSVAIRSAFSLRHHFMKVGSAYLILQLGWGVAAGVDSVLIMAAKGAGAVAIFSVTQRLFQLVAQPLIVMNAPLWAAYADASARDERQFIRNTFKRSMMLTTVFSLVGGSLILVVGESLVSWWTGGIVTLPLGLVLMLFILTSVEALSNALAVMLNGCGIIREQVITVTILTAAALAVKWFTVNRWGVTEMLASYVAVYSLIMFFMYGVVFRKRLIACMKTG